MGRMSEWAPAGQFSAHNVVLPDGRMTLPGEPLLKGTYIFQRALEQLRAHVKIGGLVADLGCLDGGYAAEFARAGYEAEGIEAREVNIERARVLQAQLALPNLRFAHADVRQYLRSIEILGGRYDAVFCCGLLYHLDKPAEFLQLVGRLTPLLILNTHYSAQPDAENEGYEGHWYNDNLGDRWSSYGNERSFWPTEDALLAMIGAAGFTKVERLDDERREARGMWVARR